MICQKCGSDVIRTFAGSVEVLRHVVAPKVAHYPRPVVDPQSASEAVPPEPHLASIPVEVPLAPSPAQQPD